MSVVGPSAEKDHGVHLPSMVIVFDINRPRGFLLRAWTQVSVLKEHICFHAAVRVLAKDLFECLRLTYHVVILY